MNTPDQSPSPADLAEEIGGLSVGLGTIGMTLFPLALPGLLLALLLVLPAVPLLLIAGIGYLLVRILMRAFGLVRGIWRRLRSRPGGGSGAPERAPQRGAPAGMQTRNPTLESRRSGPAATRT
jgi:hypothetical protein